jgi:hypothetical protein
MEHGGESVAMSASALLAGRAGRSGAWRSRLALMGLCVLLAASAAVTLAAGLMPAPAVMPGAGGCPAESTATARYQRDQLRYGQLAELLRFAALACALQAVRTLPRSAVPLSSRRHLAAAVLVVLLAGLGLYPLYSASGTMSLLSPALPALLSLTTAAAVVVVTVRRALGPARRTLLLSAGVVLTTLPVVLAVEGLTALHRESEPNRYTGRWAVCVHAEMSEQWSAFHGLVVVVTGLLLSGPALLIWSAVREERTAR